MEHRFCTPEPSKKFESKFTVEDLQNIPVIGSRRIANPAVPAPIMKLKSSIVNNRESESIDPEVLAKAKQFVK
jgi:hypothetical protein